MKNPFLYFKTSPEIIRLAVMMYVRFPLSLRQVEDLLHERGIDICHETVRAWWNRFGPMLAADIKRKRSASMRTNIQWRWHLDEVFVRINGETHYLWRAVDHKGKVLEVFVTKRRDRNAALRFLRKAMKRFGRPEVIMTDKLRSYQAAMKVIGNAEAPPRYKNSPLFTLQLIAISTKNAISTIVKTSNSIALSPWQSGVKLRPDIYRLRGCTDQFAFP